MKQQLVIICLLALVTSCASPVRNGGELVGVHGTAWNEPAPFGMVLVEKGSFNMGAEKPDSLWGETRATNKHVSVESFWMDDTEITNAEYKQFVYWVRDSIIRERLADPAFGGNEAFKIEEDQYGEPIEPRLDWKRPIPWRNPTEDEAMAIESLYKTNPITGKKELDVEQLNYKYEVYDHTLAAQRQYRLDPNKRQFNTDLKSDNNDIILISKDTAYIDDDGKVVNRTITRRRESPYDFLHTRIVTVYPDTTTWVNDFNNSFNEPYMQLYFNHPGYSNYPVVGVTWEQATAFCAWRTNFLLAGYGMQRADYLQRYRLPSEAEWEYAARAGRDDTPYPWQGDVPHAEKGCFYANFKPADGNYVKDGSLITSAVGTYPPNEFGLYDMSGNVSEWTSTFYTEAVGELSGDMNPQVNYDAAQEDDYRMKRKIVRGGSWKDVSKFVRSDMRMWEYQNMPRSYIGFRCVRSYIGFDQRRQR